MEKPLMRWRAKNAAKLGAGSVPSARGPVAA